MLFPVAVLLYSIYISDFLYRRYRQLSNKGGDNNRAGKNAITFTSERQSANAVRLEEFVATTE